MNIASIEKLISVEPHPNADRLDLVKVLGYQCVTERGLHKAGDVIVYVQPDTILPEDQEWAEGFRKYAPRRVKAVKLRGEYSEGIIVRFDQVADLLNLDTTLPTPVGLEVADLIGVKHYEPPLPQDLSAKRLLPFGIPKTDETRWENMISRLPIGEPVDVTLKIDGQSWSAYYNLKTGEFGVMGRTMEYKDDATNNYTAQIERYDIKEKLIAYCKKHGVSVCLRGESYGQGIQKSDLNPHSKMEKGLGIFSVYLIDSHRYARPGEPHYFIDVCEELDLPTVPILERQVTLTRELIDKYSVGLKKVNGMKFEGVVINHGEYFIESEPNDVTLPTGEILHVEGKKMKYVPNSFKVINKGYDAAK